MEKLITIILMIVLALSVTACDTDGNSADTASDTTPVTTNGSEVTTNATTERTNEETISLIGRWSVAHIIDSGEQLTIADFAETWNVADTSLDMSAMVYEMYSSLVIEFVDDDNGIATIIANGDKNELAFTYNSESNPIVLIGEDGLFIDGGALGHFEFVFDNVVGQLINQTISSAEDTYYVLKRNT